MFNVYGPNQPKSFFIPDMIEKIKNNQSIKIDKSVRDFIHVNTVSRVINFIISKEITGVLNIGSGRGQSLKSIINLIGNKLDKKPLLEISNKKSKIVANIKFLTSKGFKFKKYEKNFNI